MDCPELGGESPEDLLIVDEEIVGHGHEYEALGGVQDHVVVVGKVYVIVSSFAGGPHTTKFPFTLEPQIWFEPPVPLQGILQSEKSTLG